MVMKRGIFERVKGSGIWWIRWTDQAGRKRREKIGTFSAATKLLAKRHTQKLEGAKLPENLRSKAVISASCVTMPLPTVNPRTARSRHMSFACALISSLRNLARVPWSPSRRTTLSVG